MISITVALPDEIMHKLKELAERHRVTPEDLVRVSVEALVTSPQESFKDTIDYILNKNEELYKRLAA